MAIRRINGILLGQGADPTPTPTNLPYKVYSAFLNQHDEYDPVATVIQNELGTVNWQRWAQGIFQAISDRPIFTLGKRVIITGTPDSVQAPWGFLEYTDEGVDAQYIRIECLDALGYDSDTLVNQYIEIRIYE